MIQVDGFSKQQRALADIMWGLETEDEVQSFIEGLPKAQQQDAETVLSMLTWAMIDTFEQVDPVITQELNKIFHSKD